MRFIRNLTVFIGTLGFVFFSFSGYSQNNDFETLVYFQQDTLQLEMDVFLPENVTGTNRPLILYVHGGGFSQGNRTAGHNLCRFLAQHGYVAASITYTLYMKGKSFGCDGILAEKIKAIQIAANQLWQATIFFREHWAEYSIDTSQIFIAGSSAGAETVLHAAFWNRSELSIYQPRLPEGFQYAGVVAGAGAIMDLNLIHSENAIPVMMFHGNADPLVPYGTAAHHFCPPDAPGWLMFFGSHSIFQHLGQLGISARLTTFDGGGHGFAGAYFYQNQEPVLDFLEKIRQGKIFQEHHLIPGSR